MPFLDELQRNLSNWEQKRYQKLENLLTTLNAQEFERESKSSSLCDKLLTTLIDIAFILEPEANVLVDVYTAKLLGSSQFL